MTNIYEKIDAALKEICKLQDLIRQGLAKPDEKQKAFEIAKTVAALFTDDIFKRKAEKLSKVTVWSKQSRDGFVAADEASQLDGWVALLEEYKEGKKIKAQLSSDKVDVQSVVDGEDQHIFITEKGSGSHTHLILDGGTGEIRIDPKDKPPHDLIKSIKATLQLKTGEAIQITKSELSFVEPESPRTDVRAYTANKDGYFVLEIYNNGDEDLEEFEVRAMSLQLNGHQETAINQFYYEADYLVKASAKSLNMLKRGERVHAHLVSISVNKKVKVTITCKGMKSGNAVKKVFDLETKNQYQQPY